MSVLIFGGNSDVNVANYLQNLLFSKSTNPLVSEFLVAVNLKLRQSFSNLPSATKSHLPPFSNLREFVNQYITNGSQNPVIDTFLLSIIQLADYIVYEYLFPQSPVQNKLTIELSRFNETDSSPAPQQRSIISVSYGLIAGVTAAILPRGTAGIELAAHAVQITLKLALYIDGYARSLFIPEPVQGLKSWSLDIIALKQTDVEVLIEDFIADSVGPLTPTSH